MDNTISVVTFEYFSMRYGGIVKSTISLEEYERLTAAYNEDAAFWKRHGITTADDFVRLVLSWQ